MNTRQFFLGRVMFALCAVVGASACVSASEPEWGQFRGPGARGIADGLGIPSTWSATENVAWKQDLPGRGWSSPIVVGQRIFVTSCVNSGESEPPKKGLYFGGDRPKAPTAMHTWQVTCLDLATGDILWNRQVHEQVPTYGLHIKNSYASETPVSDGERVYAYFGNVGLYCLDLEGEIVWARKFEPRPTRFQWGTAASPVLDGDRIYIVSDNEEASFLAAYNKKTGDEIWRKPRDEKSNWATPYVWHNSLRTEIITPGTGKTRAYGVDGELLYEFGGASSITIATPYAVDDLLYVSSGYILDPKKPIWALRPGASGDITLGDEETSNASIVWCAKQAAPYNPSTIVYRDQLYVLLDQGFVTSYDPRSGEEIYGKQRLPMGRAFTASPWAADGKLFFLNEYGTTFVVKAGPTFELLGTNELGEDEMCMATPAVAPGTLLIRTAERLYAIREKK